MGWTRGRERERERMNDNAKTCKKGAITHRPTLIPLTGYQSSLIFAIKNTYPLHFLFLPYVTEKTTSN
jgi:hypothetical protein